ncbi:hypothetical protein [Methylobacterium gossipiicola]|uniref:Uncharacterized protein n=1 Tax=Methylobacterium gossipiicola TaxID=582675 RepID=A0A1I2WU49_9HYPH|nr:hypothetical protein [Methylobacterium gossipiicola]SFH04815.1 hypothetical protein SAMN05192565_12736 [Methylobacterium gossipiicola]
MSPAPILHPRDIPAVTSILLRDGREVRIDDITTAEQGRLVLAELDGTILAIEDQIAHSDQTTPEAQDWRVRAERALKVKRRSRPTLQARIGTLGRAEKAAAHAAVLGQKAVQVDAKRQAFVHAAYEMVGHEVCTEIWARAAELKPEVFANGVAGGPA